MQQYLFSQFLGLHFSDVFVILYEQIFGTLADNKSFRQKMRKKCLSRWNTRGKEGKKLLKDF